jgi:hypothetical protein
MNKGKKRYVSYSEINTYYNYGKEVYYKSYILGIREAPSRPMVFGSLTHRMLSEPKFDYEKAIVDAGFTDDFIRIGKSFKSRTPRCSKHEVGWFVDFQDFSLYAGIDGTDEECLTEYKTSSAFWTPQRVEEDEQMTHYTFCYKLKYGKLLPFRLICLNTKNGKVKEFRTHRTEEQLKKWEEKLIQFKSDLINDNYWDKKCKFADRTQL